MSTPGQAAELVRLEVEGAVGVVTLNRPEKLNAINTELRTGLDRAIDEVAGDPRVRVVVLTGAGRAFCAGADLGGGTASDPLAVSRNYDETADRQLRLRDLPQPVIAAVHGYCLGRGMELALWCDLVVASTDAMFGEPEIRDGSFVASILPWLVGAQQAKLIMLTGDRIGAARAHALGLVAELAEPGTAYDTAMALARRIAHVPPAAATAVKRYVNAAQDGVGLPAMQRQGSTTSAFLHTLPPETLGIAHLVRLRQEQGLKAYLTARDEPFERRTNHSAPDQR